MLHGLRHLPQAVVGCTQVAQIGPLPPPVADLAADGQRLLVVLDGPLHLPQVGVGQSQVAQNDPFRLLVTLLLRQRPHPLQVSDGLSRTALPLRSQRQQVERGNVLPLPA